MSGTILKKRVNPRIGAARNHDSVQAYRRHQSPSVPDATRQDAQIAHGNRGQKSRSCNKLILLASRHIGSRAGKSDNDQCHEAKQIKDYGQYAHALILSTEQQLTNKMLPAKPMNIRRLWKYWPELVAVLILLNGLIMLPFVLEDWVHRVINSVMEDVRRLMR